MNREDFPILNNNIIYFDSGATTLKPKVVIDKTVDYYSNYSANAHRGDYNISARVDEEYENARETIASFINADSSEIVFTSGSTDSINIIVDGYFRNKLKQGDKVLITESEHASNILPWFRLKEKLGIEVDYIPLDENYEVTLDNLKSVIDDSVKIISIAHITNVIGDIRPVKEICEYAHESGIEVLIDGAQAIPHIKVDVKEIDSDFYVASAHKMLGPTGIGILYAKKEILENIEPHNLGGGMNQSFEKDGTYTLKNIPTRFEAGTQNIAGILAFKEAIDYINKIGIDSITKHEIELKEYFLDLIKDINHINVINPNSKSGIVAFTIDDIFAQDVAYYLNKYNICVRAGNHCAKILKDVIGTTNTVRVSFYLYNTKEEVNTLVDLLKDKDRIMKEMI